MTQAAAASPPAKNKSTSTEPQQASNADLNQIVSFQLGNEEYGLDIMRVQEIILVGDITQMPQVPHYVRGMINLRGHVIPVIDLRTRFKLPACEKTEEQRIIVVNVGERTIGIVVDAVNQVLRVTEDQIEPAPSGIAGVNHNFITGLLKIDDKLIIVLDIDHLFSNEEQDALGEMAPQDKET